MKEGVTEHSGVTCVWRGQSWQPGAGHSLGAEPHLKPEGKLGHQALEKAGLGLCTLNVPLGEADAVGRAGYEWEWGHCARCSCDI